jgi:hypothetical protein
MEDRAMKRGTWPDAVGILVGLAAYFVSYSLFRASGASGYKILGGVVVGSLACYFLVDSLARELGRNRLFPLLLGAATGALGGLLLALPAAFIYRWRLKRALRSAT